MSAIGKHKKQKWFCFTLLCFLCFVAAHFHGQPRAWAVAEVPVAFWAWRTQAPDEVDVRAAVEKASARVVFLRAGQIDYQNGNLRRIRPLAGTFPRGIKLYLVYNATRALLDQFETVDPNALANEIARAYGDDAQRAVSDGADLNGLQLDIDVPTRLLKHYEQTLKAIRKDIASGQQLSITGLPTWMESPALAGVLEHVDFWVPQFYGTELPARSDQMIPISPPDSLTFYLNKTRRLNRPFYAGLAAYSVALLYSASGSLIRLRGDMDPATIAADPNLELIDQHSFDNHEHRYNFHARADGVIDGLNVHAGDVLVVQLPNTESLRLAARITRELAGEKLLGICVFRLPTRDDAATLTLDQVTAALADHDSTPRVDVRLTNTERKLVLELRNTGTANALVGTLKADVVIPTGSLDSATSATGVLIETMCQNTGLGPVAPSPQPCSQRRANLLRLTPAFVAPGQTFKTTLVLNSEPATLNINITMQTDASQSYVNHQEISIDRGVKQ